MLFAVSLALVVPFISAASLPVLHPGSPDANHAIFQDRNTTSLPISLVTPLSVTGPTNSSSLGVVNAHANIPPPRYPPGYPGQPYDYFIRYSDLRIHCYKFEPDPRQNDEYVDALFAKLQLKYSDPAHRSVPLWPEDDEYYWTEGDPAIGESVLGLVLPLALDNPDYNMTYGEFSNVLIGMNNLRHDYPMLTIDTQVYREGTSHDIGLVFLDTYEPDPDMPEERVRKAE